MGLILLGLILLAGLPAANAAAAVGQTELPVETTNAVDKQAELTVMAAEAAEAVEYPKPAAPAVKAAEAVGQTGPAVETVNTVDTVGQGADKPADNTAVVLQAAHKSTRLLRSITFFKL